MKQYTVPKAFELLRQNKITSHEESRPPVVTSRHHLGFPPETRQDGWRIREGDLYAFIQSHLSEDQPYNNIYATTDAKDIRTDMCWELFFEGAIEPRRMQIKACVEHRRYPPELEKEDWEKLALEE